MSGLSLWPLMQDSRPVFDGLSLHSVMKFHSAIPGTLTEQRTVPATTCTILCSANPSLHSPVSSKMLMMTVSFKKTLNKAYLSLSYVWKKKNGSRSRIFLYKSDFHIFNSKLPIYFACPLWLPKVLWPVSLHFFQQTLNYPVPWPATDRDPSQVPAWSVIPFSPDLLQPVQPIQPSWHTLDSLSITTLFQPLPWEVTWELQIYKFSNSVRFFFPEILHTFHKWHDVKQL